MEAERDLEAKEEVTHRYMEGGGDEFLRSYGFLEGEVGGRVGKEVVVEVCGRVGERFGGGGEWDVRGGWERKVEFFRGWGGLEEEIVVGDGKGVSDEIVTACCCLVLEEEAFEDVFGEEPAILEKDAVLGGGDFLESLVCACLIDIYETRIKQYGPTTWREDEEAMKTCEAGSRKETAIKVVMQEKKSFEAMKVSVLKILGQEEKAEEETAEEDNGGNEDKEEERNEGGEAKSKKIKLW
ncbi:hypothetical protein TrVE_jg1542 [Triparma verrucosa]|uniref:Rubisco LSMT substrate-binding domain-containing protein n=1 Tax=Triparma verrucosa TaxID=1606542 RepID=A0A9W7KXP6_9STRA|nr:hypothetical protein TrVE_jg1542 [Triparma verrucosa]